ncbi:MAG: type II toxin-antitoxin system PemK/MazF family toxin [Sulfurimonadaceae bacterium]|nr:type II toxin-antitoxin system PemK/MazF family toxin [Sulfurimonadaceae bacterium]
MEINQLDIVLCEFYFSDISTTKKRPVLVFKDNLPFDDFVAIPISSQIATMYEDELLIDNTDLKEGTLPKSSKLMVRKTFVVSKKVVLKKYGTLSEDAYVKYHQSFCQYFGCNK